MKLSHLLLPTGILAAGVVAIFLIMATKAEPKLDKNKLAEPPKTQVLVSPIVRQTATLSVTSQGTVNAKRAINLVAQVSGQVMNVSEQFVDGEFFKQGDVLINIDDTDYQTALLNAEFKLSQAKRLLAEEKGRSRQAKREWRDLKNQEANDLFLRKPQLAQAEAEVKFAEANVALAKLNIERTNITAPFNGRIKKTNVNVGQFVGVGTRLADIYDTGSVEVRLPLSDRQIALLDLPITGRALQHKPQVQLTGIIGGKTHTWPAVITRTEASVEVNSRMYYAIAEVEKPFELYESAPLMPGLFVSAEIAGKALSDVIVLPKEAIVKRQHLYILDENNTVISTPVNVLNRHQDKVWLTADIRDDTQVLLEKHAVVSVGSEIIPILNSNTDDVIANDVSVAKVGE